MQREIKEQEKKEKKNVDWEANMAKPRKDFSIWLKIHSSQFFFSSRGCSAWKEMTKPALSAWGENDPSRNVALH